jgi:hypothetical protein
MTDIKEKLEFTNIYQKLICVQAEMPSIEKTKQVNAGAKNYKHVELNKLLDLALPLLRKYRIFHNSICVNGNIWRVILTDSDSGEQITSDMPLLGALDMQKLGSAITYNGRYSLLGLLGLCPELDDDGQKACDPIAEPITSKLIDRSKITFNLHELWKMKEGVVRAQETVASMKAINMFKDDFVGVPDDALIKLRDWIASL